MASLRWVLSLRTVIGAPLWTYHTSPCSTPQPKWTQGDLSGRARRELCWWSHYHERFSVCMSLWFSSVSSIPTPIICYSTLVQTARLVGSFNVGHHFTTSYLLLYSLDLLSPVVRCSPNPHFSTGHLCFHLLILFTMPTPSINHGFSDKCDAIVCPLSTMPSNLLWDYMPLPLGRPYMIHVSYPGYKYR